jgi:hypothetical protein
MNIGITGHQKLPEEAWNWVEEELRTAITQATAPIIGLVSLAVGADQLFAKLILRYGGKLHIILPFPTYAETFTPGIDLESYQALLECASFIEELPPLSNREESYMAAGQRVVILSDWMIAVWNGKEAAGLGGTGDIVHYALTIRREVLHLNPERKKVTRLLPED